MAREVGGENLRKRDCGETPGLKERGEVTGITGWEASLQVGQPPSPALTPPYPTPRVNRGSGPGSLGLGNPASTPMIQPVRAGQAGPGARPLFHLSGGLRGLVAGVSSQSPGCRRGP